MLFGAINVYKPASITSRDVVNRVVRACPRKTKVGHAGTLDPMATGVLLIAIGPATKLIQYPQRQSKTYVGEFRLGFQSDTLDDTGNVVALSKSPIITKDNMHEMLSQFTGTIEQTPPQFSAVKVNGERAYKAAREGRTVQIEPRKTRIDAIEIVDFDFPNCRLEIKCGKGTYVRTLGSDIAKSLGTDAVMTSLARTEIGKYNISSSIPLDEINAESISKYIVPPRSMVSDLPEAMLGNSEIDLLRHGKTLDSRSWNHGNGTSDFNEIAGINSNGELVAVLEKKDETTFRSKINFVPHLF